MSTENDFRPTWDAERIAEVRTHIRNHTDAYFGEYVIKSGDLRSLLDELESARASERAKNTELQLASEQVSNCAAELERVRQGRHALLRVLGFLTDVAIYAQTNPGIIETDTWHGAILDAKGARASI